MMASFDIVSHQNGTLESFDSSEFSLIPEPSVGDAGVLNGHLDLSNIQSGLMAHTLHDLSMDEIQKRLVELVEDNEAMKEALKVNNTMMKEQLSTIAAWHNHMTTSMSKQQQLLSEAKEKIETLEKEKQQLLEQTVEKSLTDSETCTRKDISDEESDFEIIQQKQTKALGTLAEKLKEAEEKALQSQKEVSEKNSEIEDLKKNLNDCKQDKADLEAALLSCELKGSHFQKDLAALQIELSKVKSDNEARVEQQVKDLQEQLKEQKQCFENIREKHIETQKQLADSEAHLARVSKLLEIEHKDQSERFEKMGSECEQKQKKYLEEIDSLIAQLFDLEQKMEEREEKLQQMQSQHDLLKLEAECIPILKSQVEVYKDDLEKAGRDKESVAAEMEQMRSQLHYLQAAMSACTCGSGSAVGKATSRERGPKKPGHGSRHEDKLIYCPVCNFGFRDLQAAQNHANSCIDKAQ